MSLIAKKIGIIGGGQHSFMMTLRAQQMGFEVMVLSESKNDPAAQVANKWIKGSIYKIKDVQKITRFCEHVLLETDKVPYGFYASHFQKKKTNCLPLLEQIPLFQDRWAQKELLWDYQIPTPEFVKLTSKDEVDLAFSVFKGKVYFKKRHSFQTEDELIAIHNKADFLKFKRTHKNRETEFIAEKLLNIQNEYVLIFSRSFTGEILSYPLVKMSMQDGICYRVQGPFEHKDLKTIIPKIDHMLNQKNFVGVIHFEMLEYNGQLYVHEARPGTHNAGHVTQDAFTIDQFELQIRALMKLTFPLEIFSTQNYLMQNILGHSIRKPKLLAGLHGRLHWYDKKNNKALKKLGHINYFGPDLKLLNLQAEQDLKKLLT